MDTGLQNIQALSMCCFSRRRIQATAYWCCLACVLEKEA
jgi:hypothetical protein